MGLGPVLHMSDGDLSKIRIQLDTLSLLGLQCEITDITKSLSNRDAMAHTHHFLNHTYLTNK